MPTHKILRQWQSGNESVSQEESPSADSETNLDVAVPDASADLQANVAIDISELASLFISADQDLTIYTNDAAGGSPDDTIALKANKALVWTPNCGYSNPLSADVTALYITNASGVDTTLQIRLLQDSTP